MASTVPYDQSFYAEQFDGSSASARLLMAHLAQGWKPDSVVDVGCGRGAWLAAWAEQGVGRLVGIDGPWNSQAAMAHPSIRFEPANLEQPLTVAERFDLAISIEVVEHLSPAAGEAVVESLSRLADAVVFSAAVPGQGGGCTISTSAIPATGPASSCSGASESSTRSGPSSGRTSG